MKENLPDRPTPKKAERGKRSPRVLRTLGETAGFAATAVAAIVLTGPVRLALGARNRYHKIAEKFPKKSATEADSHEEW